MGKGKKGKGKGGKEKAKEGGRKKGGRKRREEGKRGKGRGKKGRGGRRNPACCAWMLKRQLNLTLVFPMILDVCWRCLLLC